LSITRGWTDAEVVSVDAAGWAGSTGPPLIVLAETLTGSEARAIARAAGRRQLIVVSTHRPPADAYAWLPDGTIHSLADDADASSAVPYDDALKDLLDRFANSGDPFTRGLVAEDSRTPPETLRRLVTDDSLYVIAAVAGNPAIPDEIVDLLAGLPTASVEGQPPTTISPDSPYARLMNDDVDPGSLLWGMAASPRTPGFALARIAELDDERAHADVRKFGPEVLTRTQLHRVLAGNPSTPPKAWARLLGDARDDVRQAAASNPAAPTPLLEDLLAGPDLPALIGLARNLAIPPSWCAQLADHPDFYVRRSVAGNRATPADVLMLLAADSLEPVREGVASNPSTPTELLVQMSLEVQTLWDCPQALLSRPELGEAAIRRLYGLHGPDDESEPLTYLSMNPSTPVDILERLFEVVPADMGGNPSLPPHLLAILADHQSEWTRIAVQQNPSTPERTLRRLAAVADDETRLRVGLNPATPRDVVASLQPM
jgi:hypothetical protein